MIFSNTVLCSRVSEILLKNRCVSAQRNMCCRAQVHCRQATHHIFFIPGSIRAVARTGCIGNVCCGESIVFIQIRKLVVLFSFTYTHKHTAFYVLSVIHSRCAITADAMFPSRRSTHLFCVIQTLSISK